MKTKQKIKKQKNPYAITNAVIIFFALSLIIIGGFLAFGEKPEKTLSPPSTSKTPALNSGGGLQPIDAKTLPKAVRPNLDLLKESTKVSIISIKDEPLLSVKKRPLGIKLTVQTKKDIGSGVVKFSEMTPTKDHNNKLSLLKKHPKTEVLRFIKKYSVKKVNETQVEDFIYLYLPEYVVRDEPTGLKCLPNKMNNTSDTEAKYTFTIAGNTIETTNTYNPQKWEKSWENEGVKGCESLQ